MNTLASALTGTNGERVALTDVAVTATLQDLLAEVCVTQTYRNDEAVNIEAVYTFPLPLDAVLLELEVGIGGRKLQGVVVEKQKAERKYEDAIEAGDAAVMLQELEPGLYTMNVGNLLPKETARITFRYAILYRWSGDRLRFFLPTTIAPRYGESPHAAHQAPEASLSVKNQFSLRVEVRGALRDAQFTCPSHSVALERHDGHTVISLTQPKAVMDHDFILNAKAAQATRSFALSGQDGEGIAVIASFQPFFPGLQQPRALKLAILIDCSGSMAGDSLAQAKQALAGILDTLQPQDEMTLIGFGDSTSAMTQQLTRCTKTHLANARRFAKALDADLGGTEIGGALRDTYDLIGDAREADIFLVTDGEVSRWKEIVEEAKQSGHRIFTVGVGSAVSEAFVRGLAAATGGACELVSPREGMAERVVRHFERLRAPRAKRVAVHWPEGAREVTPSSIGAVFEGDTVVASAVLNSLTAGVSATLEVETEKGEVFRQELPLPAVPDAASADGLSTVARIAAATRLQAANATTGLQTALRYQLVSRWTHCLVVAARSEEDKALDIPALRKVPQSLAAGWGGTGSVVTSRRMASGAPRDAYFSMEFAPAFERVRKCQKEASTSEPEEIPPPYDRLMYLIDSDPTLLRDGHSVFELLRHSRVYAEFEDVFKLASELGISPHAVAALLVGRLLTGPLKRFVAPEAEPAVRALERLSRVATKTLREMVRHGAGIAELSQATLSDIRILERDNEEWIGRMLGIDALLAHIERAVERSATRVGA